MFRARANPLYSRLYYVLSARESERIIAAKSEFEAAHAQVRAEIYDSVLVESKFPPDLPEKCDRLRERGRIGGGAFSCVCEMIAQ